MRISCVRTRGHDGMILHFLSPFYVHRRLLKKHLPLCSQVVSTAYVNQLMVLLSSEKRFFDQKFFQPD